MAQISERYHQILGEIERVLDQIDAAEATALLEAIVRARCVFVHGMGRGGLVMRAFAMRLMHLGLNVAVVGEITTPGIGTRDLLLLNSARGVSATAEALVDKALGTGAQVAVLTAHAEAELAQRAHSMVVLPAQTWADIEGSHSMQPMGTLYEQVLWIFCDGLVLELQRMLGQSAAEMRLRHANLE